MVILVAVLGHGWLRLPAEEQRSDLGRELPPRVELWMISHLIQQGMNHPENEKVKKTRHVCPVPHQVVGGDDAEDKGHAHEDVHVAAAEEEVEAPAAAVIDFRQRQCSGHQNSARRLLTHSQGDSTFFEPLDSV